MSTEKSKLFTIGEKPPVLSPLAQEFIALMNSAGWNQAETSRQLRVTAPFISQICNGHAQPTRAMVQLLKLTLAAQNPDAVRFDSAAGSPAKIRDQTAPTLPEWATDLIRELAALTPEDRQQVIIAIRAFLKAMPKRKMSYSQAKRASK